MWLFSMETELSSCYNATWLERREKGYKRPKTSKTELHGTLKPYSFWSLLQTLLGLQDYWSQNSQLFINTMQEIKCTFWHSKEPCEIVFFTQSFIHSGYFWNKNPQSSPIWERMNSEYISKTDLDSNIILNSFSFLVLFFWNRVLLYSPGRSDTHVILSASVLQMLGFQLGPQHLTVGNNCWLK